MENAIDLCIPDTPGHNRVRRWIMSELFPGKWRDRDKVRIVDKYGLGERFLLWLLCTVGINALIPQAIFPVLQRKNWTEADTSVNKILLPSLCFGIFQFGYRWAASQQSAGMVGSTPIFAGFCRVPF